MSENTNDYLNLITSEHRDKPKFIAMVTLGVSLSVQLQKLYDEMIARLDIDDVNQCVGIWLDYIGQWVGVSRNVRVPIPGVYFSWDDIDSKGWDYGSWYDGFGPSGITSLPDDAYRTLIKAKIAANHWDGTVEGAYAVWATVFPDINLLIQDNQDMTMIFALQGAIIDSLTLALLTGGYIPLKPEGVHVNFYAVPVDTNPIFSWDVESAFVDGWDIGSWAREVAPT